MNKHDDEKFTDDELPEMEAALHLVHAQRHALDGAADHDDEANDDEKISKQEAHYRPGTTHRFCEACSMFLYPHRDTKDGDGGCSLVAGNISPAALCDHFERQKERAAGGPADQDESHRGVYYERVKGVASPGSFRLPHHAIHKLGGGDGRTAGKVLKSLFAVDPDSPDIIPAETVRHLGHGDLRAGRRVLEKFIARLRRPGVQSIIEQPDGNGGRAA
jgi:hypothetical protein